MATDSSVENMVCPNHPERAAATRCRACLKPICAECIVEVEGEDFCTKDCANNHFVTEAHMEKLRLREALRRRRRLIRRLIALALFLLLAGGAWFVWSHVLTPQQKRKIMTTLGQPEASAPPGEPAAEEE